VSTTSRSPKITEGAVVVPPPENIAVLEQMGLPAKAKAIPDLQMRSSSREIPVKMLTLKPKPGTETHEKALYVRMSQSSAGVHELMFPEFADASFITSLLTALTATPDRPVSDTSYHHNFPVRDLTGVEMDRTAKVISGAIPYSLPLDLTS
jgi:hypothetical protein